MAPTRVGFIGLSKSGWAPRAHLPYLKSSPDYEIVAICNSSVESAREAIKLYELPSSVKAYANPEGKSRPHVILSISNSIKLTNTSDIANDKDVDLVVCSVRVDRHLPTISPSLRAGKDVLVEWPLGKNLAEAEELLALKNVGGVKNAVVDLQARQAPIVRKAKELIEQGKIGSVLSSTWTGAAGTFGAGYGKSYEYLGRREVGGNMVTIHFGHAVDYVQYVLGYGFNEHGAKSVVANRRPILKLLEDDGKTVIEEKHVKTSDDTIFLTGTLSSGIPLSFSLRGDKAFKNTPGLDWRIYGSTGEIRITASGPFLQIGYPDLKLEVYDFESDVLEEVEVGDDLEEVEGPAKNVGRVYRGVGEGENNCTFEDAVERHRLIAGMYRENGIEN
ncbi:Galactose/lactose metabolism regulatory protein GAL80 [Lachnellula suecica]|uniref:Galactose/lactose metabolism regulatory protein GAL80 n=1 Tax=Lachnellula suecica TaxID=602035 RepID=A0A8T9C4W0_9HELO|nr:Galactose/lactose metabolism regulatory protein GAL80 [Lachnellula suecica]